MAEPVRPSLEIAFQQILLADASVYSVQWTDVPDRLASRVTPQFLLDCYFKVIRNATFRLVRPVVTGLGIDFCLISRRFPLLSFEPPRLEQVEEGEAIHLYICGGFLVQPGECDRGLFSLACSRKDGFVRVTVQLTDYCPLLLGSSTPSRIRKLSYRWTQSYLHKVVTVRYLASLYRELTGAKPRAGVIKVRVREGSDI